MTQYKTTRHPTAAPHVLGSGFSYLRESRILYCTPIASYTTIITYDAIPISRGKKMLYEYYTKIWDATYVNSAKASHTKVIIPSIHHRMTISLWPKHGCFRGLQCRILTAFFRKPTRVSLLSLFPETPTMYDVLCTHNSTR